MAGKLTVTVYPSGTDSTDLTVSDALHQILDLINLLTSAEQAEGGEQIVWRLKSASTNTPFRLEAEPTGRDPSVSVAFQARRAGTAVRTALDALANGRVETDWLDEGSIRTAKRFFERNTNGVGRTDILFEEDQTPLIVVHANARTAVRAIEQDELDRGTAAVDWTHTEYGAVEGDVVAAVQFHNRPALTLRERLSGERITCVLSPEIALQIGPQHSWDEVWSGKRVLVNGAVYYNEAGQISRVDADSVEPISPMPADVQAARSADITNGLSPVDFLSRVWGDSDGQD